MVGTVEEAQREPATTVLLGHVLSVRAERELARTLIVIALGALVAGGVTFSRRRRGDERSRIRTRYGSGIIAIATSPSGPGRPVVEVDGIRSLVRLAEAHDHPILELVDETGTAYFVDTGSLLYGYILEDEGASPPSSSNREPGLKLVSSAS